MKQYNEEQINSRVSLLNAMIDDRCDTFGVHNTIAYLMECGVSEEELLNEFYFDSDDVIYVKENLNNPNADSVN